MMVTPRVLLSTPQQNVEETKDNFGESSAQAEKRVMLYLSFDKLLKRLKNTKCHFILTLEISRPPSTPYGGTYYEKLILAQDGPSSIINI